MLLLIYAGKTRLQECVNVIICTEFLQTQTICYIKGRICRKLAPNMLLDSASEEKWEWGCHSAILKCKSNNVYKFGDPLPIVALVESVDDYHHQSIREYHRTNWFNNQLLKLAFMRPMENMMVPT